jgi:hypothetical protein
MDFEQRLQRAIERGEKSRDVRDRAAVERQLSAEELRSRHSSARTDLSDTIEACLRKLGDHYPGFQYQSLIGADGWGAKISRDDLRLQPGRASETLYSRLEMIVTPMGNVPIIEVVGKGTIRNREVYHRRHYQQLSQLDLHVFEQMIEQWVLEYAEQYAAQ